MGRAGRRRLLRRAVTLLAVPVLITLLYVAVSLVITGMQKYSDIDPDDPVLGDRPATVNSDTILLLRVEPSSSTS